MKLRWGTGWIALLMMTTLSAGCGGGGGREYAIRAEYPARLAPHAAELLAAATIVGEEGAILSAPAEGRLEGGLWRFAPEPFSDLPEGALLRVDFSRPASPPAKGSEPASMQLLPLAAAMIPLALFEASDEVAPAEELFDFAPDADGDGLANIDELLFGVDPYLADSDGDGRKDGADAFPSLAAEWGDVDGDGIGDNSDDDIDGDGWSNTEERIYGTDPFSADTDGDGARDSADLCPHAADPEQGDVDGDGAGDACDDDADGDGLGSADEIRRGTDPARPDSDNDGLGDGAEVQAGSDPLRTESDGDGLIDGSDNCPAAANADQADADRDGEGDACDNDRDGDGVANGADNCPDAANAAQENVDGDGAGDECDADADGDGFSNLQDSCPFLPNPAQRKDDGDGDGVAVECDLDDSDAGVGDDRSGIFVDGSHGSDGAAGTRANPLATLKAGLMRAAAEGKPLYAAAGSYDVSSLALPSGARLYGGFRNGVAAAERFSGRDAQSSDPAHRTILTRRDATTTLALSADVLLGGFSIENDATGGDAAHPAATVTIAGGAPSIERCRISGHTSSVRSTGFKISAGSPRILRSFISGGGFDALGSEAVALEVAGGSPLVAGSILAGGSARAAVGIILSGGEPLIVGDTLDIRSGSSAQGLATGIRLEGGSPVVVDTIIATGNAPDQYAILCDGAEPDGGTKFLSNVLAGLTPDEKGPIVFECDGSFERSGNFQLGNAAVAANDYFTGDLSSLVDGDYRPTSAMLIDRGIDVSGSEFGSVREDYHGGARPRGAAYDIGAVER